jgi:hypothetical protein
MGWESFSVKNIRYRNHDIDVEFTRGKGMTIRVDGMVKAKTAVLQKISIKIPAMVPVRNSPSAQNN